VVEVKRARHSPNRPSASSARLISSWPTGCQPRGLQTRGGLRPDPSALAEPVRSNGPRRRARLKTLERENARLKRLLAEEGPDNDILRATSKRRWWLQGGAAWLQLPWRTASGSPIG